MHAEKAAVAIDQRGCEGGLLYNDPKLRLQWPLPLSIISDKDQAWKLLSEQEGEIERRLTL